MRCSNMFLNVKWFIKLCDQNNKLGNFVIYIQFLKYIKPKLNYEII